MRRPFQLEEILAGWTLIHGLGARSAGSASLQLGFHFSKYQKCFFLVNFGQKTSRSRPTGPRASGQESQSRPVRGCCAACRYPCPGPYHPLNLSRFKLNLKCHGTGHHASLVLGSGNLSRDSEFSVPERDRRGESLGSPSRLARESEAPPNVMV